MRNTASESLTFMTRFRVLASVARRDLCNSEATLQEIFVDTGIVDTKARSPVIIDTPVARLAQWSTFVGAMRERRCLEPSVRLIFLPQPGMGSSHHGAGFS
jgi:hypothetical protein